MHAGLAVFLCNWLAWRQITTPSIAGDWLVGKLQALVEVGFRMATGMAEALRPTGLALQAALLARFGAAADPLQPGARLLAQYQAQLVSSLRCCWSFILVHNLLQIPSLQLCKANAARRASAGAVPGAVGVRPQASAIVGRLDHYSSCIHYWGETSNGLYGAMF